MKDVKPSAFNRAKQLKLIHFDCPVVIVGGTNGKGSTVTLLEHVYLNAGFNVGAYRSPFFDNINEEICLNEKPISDEMLALCLEKTRDPSLSRFDHITLAALYFFKKKRPDVILLEVGLGGRLDAVNVVAADLSIITSIGYDHIAILGDTLEKIAYEKAGIIKPYQPIIFGGENPALIESYAKKKKAPFYALGRDFQCIEKPTILNKQNIAIATQALKLLNRKLPVSKSLIEKLLPYVSLKGRCQTVQKNPDVIFDVAHNPSAVQHLAHYLTERSFKKVIAVFSILKDKEIASVIHIMKHVVDRWYLVPLELERGLSLAALESFFIKAGISEYKRSSSVQSAYQSAIKEAHFEDAVVVFGTFHLSHFF